MWIMSAELWVKMLSQYIEYVLYMYNYTHFRNIFDTFASVKHQH